MYMYGADCSAESFSRPVRLDTSGNLKVLT